MAQESRLIISIDARNAEKTAKELNRELQNMTTSGNAADRQVGVLGSSLKKLAGYMAGIVTVSTAISKIDAYANLQNRLRLVTNSQEELNKATQDTFKIAQNARQEWDSVVQVYQRFSDNAKTLGINMQQTAALTDTVAKAVAISGASAQAAEAALTQFGQALGTGVLRGEELNSVMEQTPALAKAIAQGMGITIGQLRSVAAEGKITSDVLVKALGVAATDVNDKFSKMQMTIGQSITLLDNELTRFAENAGGASAVISGSIKTIAENLELISSGAIIAGVGYLTTAIVAKTTAISADVVALTAQRAASAAQLAEDIKLAQANVALTATEVANAEAKVASNVSTLALIASEKALEVERLKSQINNVGRMKTQTRMAELRVTEAAVTRDLAVAETQLAAARARANAAQATQVAASTATLTIGRSLLGVLGGPVGIGITVASLAAGYLLMSNNSEKANEKLQEQAQVANKTTQELIALEGAQRSGAKSDLAEAFKSQNEELKRLNQVIGNSIAEISSKNSADAETAKILREVRAGTMSYDEAFEKLNKSKANMPDIIRRLQGEIAQYEEQRAIVQKNADAQKVLGVEVTIAGNASQNAVGKHNQQAAALDGVNASAIGAANALSEYAKNALEAGRKAEITNKLIAKGYSSNVAADLAEVAAKNGKVTTQEANAILYKNKQVEKLNSTLEAQRKAESNASKASAKDSRDGLSQAKSDAREREQLLKEQYELREQITYNNADRIKKIETDLQKEITEIQKANFANSSQTQGFIDNAKQRADLEKRLYSAQLAAELNEWQDTEQQKLDRKVEINSLLIQLDRDMNDDLKQQALASLQDRSNLEYNEIELAKERRIFAANEAMMTEIDAMKERYRLEYAEIDNIVDAQEKAALKQALARSSIRGGTPAGGQMLNTVSDVEVYKSQTQRLQEEMAKRSEAMNAAYIAAQEAAVGNNEEMLRIEEEYLTARAELQAEFDRKAAQTRKQEFLGNFETTAGMFDSLSSSFASLTETIKNQSGEQSAEYRKMFEFQKQFAIVSAIINGGLAVSQVWADPSLNFYAKIAASIATGVATAANVAMISSQQPQGFKSGGYTGNVGVNQEAGVVHGQEFVLNAEATRRVGVGTLEAINSGKSFGVQTAQAQGDVNLNNINVLDPSLLDQYMQTQAGTKTFINTIANNKSKINAALGR